MHIDHFYVYMLIPLSLSSSPTGSASTSDAALCLRKYGFVTNLGYALFSYLGPSKRGVHYAGTVLPYLQVKMVINNAQSSNHKNHIPYPQDIWLLLLSNDGTLLKWNDPPQSAWHYQLAWVYQARASVKYPVKWSGYRRWAKSPWLNTLTKSNVLEWV